MIINDRNFIAKPVIVGLDIDEATKLLTLATLLVTITTKPILTGEPLTELELKAFKMADELIPVFGTVNEALVTAKDRAHRS